MKIGRFTIEQLSEGFFELFKDGTFSKMDPARLNNAAEDPTLGRYSSALGIDPLLISNGTTHIVADAGLGWGLDQKSDYKETSNLVTNLEIFELTPDDISIVILSHLHYDHAAGCTRVDSSFKTAPTFPNARYVVQKREWEFALKKSQSGSDMSGADYRLDELFRLAADERFEFIDGNKTLTDGIDLILTGGHTPGHQIVKITDGTQKAYFLGDLIPTEHHLNHYAMKTLDFSPLEAKKSKTLILRQAYREQAQLFFYHSLFNKNGLLAKDRNRNYILKEERR